MTDKRSTSKSITERATRRRRTQDDGPGAEGQRRSYRDGVTETE